MPINDDQDLEKQLERLGAAVLARFVARLAETDRTVEERVEALVLQNDSVRLEKALRKRLGNIKRGHRYIDYRESFEFGSSLDHFLDDLDEGLLPRAPEAAAEIAMAFIKADERILNRVDDSGGAIGQVFRRACGLWARAVAQLPPSTDRVARLYDLHAKNDYGVRDGLLNAAAIMLDELELRRLARRYEDDLKAALAAKREGRQSIDVYSASAAMGQVACTLEDAVLYERTTLLLSPNPNHLQREGIAKNYIRFGPVEKAIEWLERSDRQNLHLLAEAIEKLGDHNRLLDVRKRLFAQTLEPEHLTSYLELLPDADRARGRRNAAKLAVGSPNLPSALRLLFALGEAESAEALALERSDELEHVFYTSLKNLAESASKADCPLLATLCFRALLDQILDEGRSKAYGHARRYHVRLLQLASDIANWRELVSHENYMATLREKHGRKWSFWKLIDKEKS